jgi:hypothetical protein
MRYHHFDDCHGYGYHGCGYGYGHGWGPTWTAPDYPFEAPVSYGLRRGRRLGYAASRGAAQQRLEGYLESLRDEMRAVEQDLQDLSSDAEKETGPAV